MGPCRLDGCRFGARYLGDGQLLALLPALLGVGAGVRVAEGHQWAEARPVERLEGELRAEQVADGP